MFIDRQLALRTVRREVRDLPAHFSGCVMCSLVAHTPKTHIVVRSRRSVAVLARFGVRRGHILVVMRNHREQWAEVTWKEWEDAQRLAWEISRALETTLGAKRVYVASLGSARQKPMTFPHHHLHVVPTYYGDRRDRPADVFTWQRGVVMPTEDEAIELTTRIRKALPA
jgi:diadenosine tetraphosphate (Ap4A) HIT family hydrolase